MTTFSPYSVPMRRQIPSLHGPGIGARPKTKPNPAANIQPPTGGLADTAGIQALQQKLGNEFQLPINPVRELPVRARRPGEVEAEQQLKQLMAQSKQDASARDLHAEFAAKGKQAEFEKLAFGGVLRLANGASKLMGGVNKVVGNGGRAIGNAVAGGVLGASVAPEGSGTTGAVAGAIGGAALGSNRFRGMVSNAGRKMLGVDPNRASNLRDLQARLGPRPAPPSPITPIGYGVNPTPTPAAMANYAARDAAWMARSQKLNRLSAPGWRDQASRMGGTAYDMGRNAVLGTGLGLGAQHLGNTGLDMVEAGGKDRGLPADWADNSVYMRGARTAVNALPWLAGGGGLLRGFAGRVAPGLTAAAGASPVGQLANWTQKAVFNPTTATVGTLATSRIGQDVLGQAAGNAGKAYAQFGTSAQAEGYRLGEQGAADYLANFAELDPAEAMKHVKSLAALPREQRPGYFQKNLLPSLQQKYLKGSGFEGMVGADGKFNWGNMIGSGVNQLFDSTVGNFFSPEQLKGMNTWHKGLSLAGLGLGAYGLLNGGQGMALPVGAAMATSPLWLPHLQKYFSGGTTDQAAPGAQAQAPPAAPQKQVTMNQPQLPTDAGDAALANANINNHNQLQFQQQLQQRTQAL